MAPQRAPRSPYKSKPARLVPKETKSSYLRAQSLSRSPSPQPIEVKETKSREASPSLPGRRRDYTKGKVSNFFEYFFKKYFILIHFRYLNTVNILVEEKNTRGRKERKKRKVSENLD